MDMKMFELYDGGETHWIIAPSKERALNFWYEELAGDPISKDAEITELNKDEKVPCREEDGENVVTKTVEEWIKEEGDEVMVFSSTCY